MSRKREITKEELFDKIVETNINYYLATANEGVKEMGTLHNVYISTDGDLIGEDDHALIIDWRNADIEEETETVNDPIYNIKIDLTILKIFPHA